MCQGPYTIGPRTRHRIDLPPKHRFKIPARAGARSEVLICVAYTIGIPPFDLPARSNVLFGQTPDRRLASATRCCTFVKKLGRQGVRTEKGG